MIEERQKHYDLRSSLNSLQSDVITTREQNKALIKETETLRQETQNFKEQESQLKTTIDMHIYNSEQNIII